jgi:cyclopropane fatty-acyl-phospholipid synthase-like methyltransferase
MTIPDTSSATFFEAKYRRESDPWNFLQSPYECARYDAILKALRGRHYRRTFEPGCSIGALTIRLADICDEIEASDFSPTAVKEARKRCENLSSVRIRCCPLSEEKDFGRFDLVVLSEIGYYFVAPDWRELAERCVATMENDSILLAAHWLGNSTDHRMSGDEVHAILASNASLLLEHSERQEFFRIDRWRKA